MPARVILYTRRGCHLCDAARRVVEDVAEHAAVSHEEIDVDTDPELQAEHGELVPVVTVDGHRIGYWRIDAEKLRAALREPASERRWWRRSPR